MKDVKFLPKVIEYDRYQSEFMKILKHIYQKEQIRKKLNQVFQYTKRIKN